MIMDRRFRDAAPDAFAFPGDNFYEIGGTDDFLRWAFPLFKHGADGFYCSGSLATVRAMADHGLPVCGHVGLIPSKATWTGGFKAVGKTLETAQLVWNQCKALEEAGAFAVEIEVVPHSITKAIAERTGLFLISMGAGAAGHAQYLFSDDVLGQNRGHVPRHAKRYANLAAEFDRLQQMRIDAMTRFAQDVHEGDYPPPAPCRLQRRGGHPVPRLAGRAVRPPTPNCARPGFRPNRPWTIGRKSNARSIPRQSGGTKAADSQRKPIPC